MSKDQTSRGKMYWWAVFETEYSGYDCNGHRVVHFVGCNTDPTQYMKPEHEWDEKPTAFRLDELPDISTRRNMVFMDNWYLDGLKGKTPRKSDAWKYEKITPPKQEVKDDQ